MVLARMKPTHHQEHGTGIGTVKDSRQAVAYRAARKCPIQILAQMKPRKTPARGARRTRAPGEILGQVVTNRGRNCDHEITARDIAIDPVTEIREKAGGHLMWKPNRRNVVHDACEPHAVVTQCEKGAHEISVQRKVDRKHRIARGERDRSVARCGPPSAPNASEPAPRTVERLQQLGCRRACRLAMYPFLE